MSLPSLPMPSKSFTGFSGALIDALNETGDARTPFVALEGDIPLACRPGRPALWQAAAGRAARGAGEPAKSFV
jgi:hypothetical protein